MILGAPQAVLPYLEAAGAAGFGFCGFTPAANNSLITARFFSFLK